MKDNSFEIHFRSWWNASSSLVYRRAYRHGRPQKDSSLKVGFISDRVFSLEITCCCCWWYISPSPVFSCTNYPVYFGYNIEPVPRTLEKQRIFFYISFSSVLLLLFLILILTIFSFAHSPSSDQWSYTASYFCYELCASIPKKRSSRDIRDLPH